MAEVIPSALKDFIFDLHQGSRISLRSDETALAYENYKDIIEKYFAQAAWPEPSLIANECNGDEFFLVFYREMAVRHKIRDLKPQLQDMLDAWNIYQQLFNTVLSTHPTEFVLSVQWIGDILQEFVYQFQGLCQYRLLSHRTADDLRLLQANRGAWDITVVTTILKNLITAGARAGASTTLVEFGVCASVELARLQCLIGDFAGSLATLSPSNLGAAADIVMKVPSTYASVYFHAGVSQMMLHQYAQCISTFSTVLLSTHVLSRLSASTNRLTGSQTQMQKTQDKCIALLAVAMALCPSCRVDDQVKEVIDAKFSDKIRRISNGDLTCLTDLFEASCPKFINPAIPSDYTSQSETRPQNAFNQFVAAFVEGAKEGLQSLKVMKYLQLYSTIDMAKLAKISRCSESELVKHLESIKMNTSFGSSSTGSRGSSSSGSRILDVQYQWENSSKIGYAIHENQLKSLVSPTKASRGSSLQSFYVTGLKKQGDMNTTITQAFRQAGL